MDDTQDELDGCRGSRSIVKAKCDRQCLLYGSERHLPEMPMHVPQQCYEHAKPRYGFSLHRAQSYYVQLTNIVAVDTEIFLRKSRLEFSHLGNVHMAAISAKSSFNNSSLEQPSRQPFPAPAGGSTTLEFDSKSVSLEFGS